MRSRTICFPSSDFKFSPMLLLPPLTRADPRPINRPLKGSPPTGSILMTSAPMSARKEDPRGAAIMVAISTTLIPSRGGLTEPEFLGFCRGSDSHCLTSSLFLLISGPGVPGVLVSLARGPNCSPPSLRSTTCPLALMSGSWIACWVVWYVVATTPPFSMHESIHSEAGFSWMRLSIRSRNASCFSGSKNKSCLGSNSGSTRISVRSETNRKLSKR